jgi:hypothetical protein
MNFLELTKKVDEKFLNLSNNSNKKSSNFANGEKTNLKKLLQTSSNDSNDSSSNEIIGNDTDDGENNSEIIPPTNNDIIENNKNKTSSELIKIKTEMKSTAVFGRINNLQIPDTCLMDNNSNTSDKENGYFKPNGRLIIRDTIDSVNFFDLLNYEEVQQENNNDKNLSTINESNDSTPDKLSEKSKPSAVTKNLLTKQFASKNQSTPLSVKKKLQEHGLLDMTNSPSAPILTTRSKSKDCDLDRSQSIISKPPVTPTKYIQRQFEPLIESPNNKDKTPTKLVLITPTKSLNSLMKKSSSIEIDFRSKNTPTKVVTNQIEPNNAKIETPTKRTDQANDSLDFSFEFRQQQQHKKQQQSQKTSQKLEPVVSVIPNNKTKSIASTNKNIFSQNSNSSKLTNSSNKKAAAQQVNPVDIPSPNKPINNNPPAAKRFKQLTMTQAFSITQDQPSTTNNNLKNKEPKDLDETCLPDSLINNINKNKNQQNQAKTSDNNNDELVRIKPEPVENTADISNDFTSFATKSKQKNAQDTTLDADFFNEYDKVPKKQSKSPNYKHVQVVRKHDERKKLNTASCRECETVSLVYLFFNQ